MTGGLIAVTGARGRLGSALRAVSPEPLVGWSLPEYDLDRPLSAGPLFDRDRPRLVIHAAAMTQVDECARQPELALRRNGDASGVLAAACRDRGVDLLMVSTNEVFSGYRQDGRGYAEDDLAAPRNPYGASKLAGEQAAQEAFGTDRGLWIVRTAWLYGPPGNDFPDKITAAADGLADGDPLPVVADEWGSPTYALDLATAILDLVGRTDGGVYHLVNSGAASRQAWADQVLAVRRPSRTTRPISAAQFARASEPPRWGVLDASRAASAGVGMRPWEDALAAYLGG